MADYNTSLQTGQKQLDTVSVFESDGTTPVELASMNVNILSGDVALEFLGNDGNPLPANQIFIVAGLEGTSELEYTIIATDGRVAVSTVEVVVTAAPQPLVVVHTFSTPEPSGLAKARRR